MMGRRLDGRVIAMTPDLSQKFLVRFLFSLVMRLSSTVGQREKTKRETVCVPVVFAYVSHRS